MGMSAYHNIRAAFQKDPGPLFLKGICLFAFFRSPMYKYDNGICLPAGFFQISPDLIFLRKQVHHVWRILRQSDPIGSVGIIKEGKADTLSLQQLIGPVFLLIGFLDSKAGNAVLLQKGFGHIDTFRPLIQGMVGGTGDHIKAGLFYGLFHFHRGSKSGIIAVSRRVLHKRSFLIDDGHIIFL